MIITNTIVKIPRSCSSNSSSDTSSRFSLLSVSLVLSLSLLLNIIANNDTSTTTIMVMSIIIINNFIAFVINICVSSAMVFVSFMSNRNEDGEKGL